MRLPSVDTALAHIRRDAAAGRFAQWALSTLIDEFTGVPSIEKDLFDTLHAAAGIDAEFPIGNAGVLHVYGYWFSEVPTPFGYKRDLFVERRGERGRIARQTAISMLGRAIAD